MDPGPTHKVETKFGVKRRQRDRHRTMASKASTPPYPSAAKISDSLCYSQYSASLKCKLLSCFPFHYLTYPVIISSYLIVLVFYFRLTLIFVVASIFIENPLMLSFTYHFSFDGFSLNHLIFLFSFFQASFFLGYLLCEIHA